MSLTAEQIVQLDEFLYQSDYLSRGAVITDLDGTAIHEINGKAIVHMEVEKGLKKVYEHGRPVVINTLRFPLSVIRTFAKEWYQISQLPIPVVLLNGSQIGNIIKEKDEFVFQQLASFLLREKEIENVFIAIDKFMEVRDNILLFYYPEDWQMGEIIWTSQQEKTEAVHNKYKSASSVISTTLKELKEILLNTPICMILLLVELPEDGLMAYQHTKRNNFFTREHVDKQFGLKQIARIVGFELADSVGAGDSEMDVFLGHTGLSVHVRNPGLPFKGTYSTIQLKDFHNFGSLLNYLSEYQKATT
jgi:hydroxymethylpyrimidine pyrophosphatase-like HAD family hydrolase